jgi:hypothetical protein
MCTQGPDSKLQGTPKLCIELINFFGGGRIGIVLQSCKGLLKEYVHPNFVANAFEKGMFPGLLLEKR